MMPLAPGRLSTTTACLVFSSICLPIRRAEMSPAPPADLERPRGILRGLRPNGHQCRADQREDRTTIDCCIRHETRHEASLLFLVRRGALSLNRGAKKRAGWHRPASVRWNVELKWRLCGSHRATDDAHGSRSRTCRRVSGERAGLTHV